MKQFDAALEEADRALKLDPASTDALWVRGSAQVARHQPAEARQTLHILLGYEPGNRRAWLMLRTALNELGDVEGVREIDRRVEALDASPPARDTRLLASVAEKSTRPVRIGVLAMLAIGWIVRTLWDARRLLINQADLCTDGTQFPRSTKKSRQQLIDRHEVVGQRHRAPGSDVGIHPIDRQRRRADGRVVARGNRVERGAIQRGRLAIST